MKDETRLIEIKVFNLHNDVFGLGEVAEPDA